MACGKFTLGGSSSLGCCVDSPYDVSTEICCKGDILSKESSCCDDKDVSGKNGRLCCDGVPYHPNKHICCQKVLFRKDSNTVSKVLTSRYDESYHCHKIF